MLLTLILILLLSEGVVLGYLLWKLRLFLPPKNEGWLETLNQHQEELKELEKTKKKILTEIERLESILKESYLVSSIVRFTAFSQIGANQSFSLCLLNDNQNGVILTNIFTNQASRLYLKKIEKGKPQIPLSPEEKEALQKAVHQLKLIKIRSRQLSKI